MNNGGHPGANVFTLAITRVNAASFKRKINEEPRKERKPQNESKLNGPDNLKKITNSDKEQVTCEETTYPLL